MDIARLNMDRTHAYLRRYRHAMRVNALLGVERWDDDRGDVQAWAFYYRAASRRLNHALRAMRRRGQSVE